MADRRSRVWSWLLAGCTGRRSLFWRWRSVRNDWRAIQSCPPEAPTQLQRPDTPELREDRLPGPWVAEPCVRVACPAESRASDLGADVGHPAGEGPADKLEVSEEGVSSMSPRTTSRTRLKAPGWAYASYSNCIPPPDSDLESSCLRGFPLGVLGSVPGGTTSTRSGFRPACRRSRNPPLVGWCVQVIHRRAFT